MTTPLVSIVLPTYNGADTLPAVLAAIGLQRADFEYEVIAIDTSSTDGTVALLESRVDRLLTVASDAFDHGLTRNLAIEHARGEIVVMISQDAEPASSDWLMALTAPLRSNPAVAGAFARQQLRPGVCDMVRFYHQQGLTASAESRVVSVKDQVAYTALAPMDRFLLCRFDNVCSCLRRSVWTAIPFRETPIAEDLEWARDVLLAGHQIAYAADAVVLHSHERSARYEFFRTYFLHQRLFTLFGVRTIPTLGALARALLSSVRLHRRLVSARDARHRRGDVRRALFLAVAWPLGQYVGALSSVTRWNLVPRNRVRCAS